MLIGMMSSQVDELLFGSKGERLSAPKPVTAAGTLVTLVLSGFRVVMAPALIPLAATIRAYQSIFVDGDVCMVRNPR